MFHLKSIVKNNTKIIINKNFQKYLLSYIKKVQPSKIVYITDKSLYPILKRKISLKNKQVFILKKGEEEKNFLNFEKILKFYFASNIDKTSLIIAFGGGMILDIAGFTSSVYYRGIPIIYIPTSLLSQVDAAIGGKNTINFNKTKNILGTVYLPQLILIDPTLLDTLPQKQFFSGMAEIIKYSIGFDRELFKIITTQNINAKLLTKLIKQCVSIKIKLVARDIYEQGATRKLLNLGHTLGQALESENTYSLGHGEAVSIGLKFASFISYRKGNITKSDFDNILDVLKKYNLPPKIKFEKEKILNKIKFDKKRCGNYINFVLLKSIGKAYLCKLSFKNIRRHLYEFQKIY